MKKIFLQLTAVLTILICQPVLAETETKAFDEIKVIIEHSDIQEELKEPLIKKASNALNANIPADDIKIIIKRSMSQGSNSRFAEELLETSVNVKKQGLPVTPVLDRIHQGLSKGVPAEKVLEAVNRLSDNLLVAETVVTDLLKSGIRAEGTKEREESVITVARAMERSVTTDTIAEIGNSVIKHKRPLSMFGRSVDTVAALVENGAAAGPALKLVNKAMARGYSAMDMYRLEMEIFKELRGGRKMEDAIRRRESSMEMGLRPGSMRMDHRPMQTPGSGMSGQPGGHGGGMGGNGGGMGGNGGGMGGHK